MTVIKYWQRQLKGRKHFIIAHSSRGIQFPTLGKTRHQVGKKWLQAQETDQSHCIQFQKLVWAGSWGGLESLKSCPRWPASIREASPPGGPTTSKRPQLQNCSNLGAWGWPSGLLILTSHQALLLSRFLAGVSTFHSSGSSFYSYFCSVSVCLLLLFFPHPPAMLTLFAIMNLPSLFKCQINILSLPPSKKRGGVAESLQSQATLALITYLGSWNYDFEHVLDSQF